MDAAAAREARKRGKRDVVNPMLSLRHAGVSRLGALMHEKVREYYWARAAAHARRRRATLRDGDVFVGDQVCDFGCVRTNRDGGEERVRVGLNRVASFFILGVTYVGAL